ncbi:MAG: BrnT family toxin [Bryobacteraceae bacterium]
MTFEWDARKAATNLKKHRVSLEDAASVFLDPFAITFPDPDHSLEESREITIGCTMKGHLVFVSHCERGRGFGSLARAL